MSISLEAGEKQSVIRLEGDIDITCSSELKSMLIEAISSRKELRVDLSGASDLDITGIQLLWAAAREAQKEKVSFTVAGLVPESIQHAVRAAGFEAFPVPEMPGAEPVPLIGSSAKNADRR